MMTMTFIFADLSDEQKAIQVHEEDLMFSSDTAKCHAVYLKKLAEP